MQDYVTTICSDHCPVWGGVKSVYSRISLREGERARAITLTTPIFSTSDITVYDNRVSPEQTVKQQEHIFQGVAQMVMNMETGDAVPQAKAKPWCLRVFLEKCFMFAESFPASNKTSGLRIMYLKFCVFVNPLVEQSLFSVATNRQILTRQVRKTRCSSSY